MAKILIIGPIEKFGGRELEAGFIASVLNKDHKVEVFSTGNITDWSQLYEMVGGIKMQSLKQLLYRKYALLKPATFLSFIRNKRKEPIFFYVNNAFNSKFLKSKEKRVLEDVIINYDLVFIIAHLRTLRTKEIIEISNRLEKPVIFRTTGEIELKGQPPEYLKNVNLFLHHSEKNASLLHNKLQNTPYHIIDQNSYMETGLLKLPLPKRKVNSFICVARLAPEKNLINLISYFEEFSEESDELTIVGTGILYEKLLTKSRNIKNIKLTGHLSIEEVRKIYKDIECAIIPAYTEAGPLVGIDAMAAGKVILSTNVGAMPDRLAGTENDFWFRPEEKETFKNQFERIKGLEASEVFEITKKNRNTYIERYSKEVVSDQYFNSVTGVLKNKIKKCI